MASASRRLMLVVLLVAAVMTAAYAISCGTDCSVCVDGECYLCASGYSYTPNGCVSCESANCRYCETVGRCLQCNRGYRLQFVLNSTNPTFERYGQCVDGASFTGASATVVAAAMALFYVVVA